MSILTGFVNIFATSKKSENITLFDKLVIALNSRVDEQNSEFAMLLETYIKGDNGLRPRVVSKAVKLTLHELAEFTKMSPLQRVATLFILLDKQVTSRAFSKLNFDIVVELSNTISEIKSIKRAIATAILEEFYIITHSPHSIKIRGEKYLKELLHQTFNKNEIKEILNKISFKLENKKNIKYLTSYDSIKLAKFLSNEHPQVVALVLSYMPDLKAAKVISYFSKKQRVEIILRIANITRVSSEIVSEIFKLLENRLIEFESTSLKIQGKDKVSKILGYLDQNSSKELIKEISKIDFNLATTLNNRLFSFDGITKLNGDEISELLKVIDHRDLAIALKGSVDEIKEKFLSVMDKKSQKQFYNEMLFLGAVKVKNINEAKNGIIKHIYRLYELGIIQIAKV